VGKYTVEVTAYSYTTSNDGAKSPIHNTTCLLN